jgi:hypothetical protein
MEISNMISDNASANSALDRTNNKENRLTAKTADSQNSQRSAQAALQLSQAEMDAALLPKTPDQFRNTLRHSFSRRPSHITRPLIIITFQGVLGDFFKGDGISIRQDQVMSKHQASQMSNVDTSATSLWIRLGTVDGVRYLCRHF